MRIIRESKRVVLPKDSAHRFFIQAWYSLVHRNSLDSHRVRCMNSLNILRELDELIIKTHLPGIFNDIKKAAEEALEILKGDQIIQMHYQRSSSIIEELLLKIIKADKRGPETTLASYYIKDLLHDFHGSYKRNVLSSLEKAIFDDKSESDIFEFTGALLSTLIDEGYSIEGLYSIVQDIFIANKSRKSFSENYQFMKRIVDHTHSGYDIVFRLVGCNKPDFLPPKIAGVFFEKEPIFENAETRIKSFLSPGQSVLFGTIPVTAQDDRSAGLVARKTLDDVLDLMRFELEQDIIEVDTEFLSRRSDGKSRIFKLPSEIPNPTRNISAEEFASFVERLAELLTNELLDKGSKERMSSAIRFYRMGRDASQFENKFLNWWTALEYLVRHEQGDIIKEIEGKLKAVLVINYIGKYLESFRRALSYCRTVPSDSIATSYDIKSYSDLGLYDFWVFA